MRPSINRKSIEELRDRKPARTMALVPVEVLQSLHRGEIETKNLVEWLSVDRAELLSYLTKQFCLPIPLERIRDLYQNERISALKQSARVGELLADYIAVGDEHWKRLADHPCDVVREWCAILIGRTNLSFPKKLAWIKLFADDPNPGLREISWISLRGEFLDNADIPAKIKSLVPWTGSRSERLRRFASEITRPCGVWAAHLPVMKSAPEIGLSILEPLRSDDSKYVRDSVANWLNDASKSNPKWVLDLTRRWERESKTDETRYIVRRALRTLRKKEESK